MVSVYVINIAARVVINEWAQVYRDKVIILQRNKHVLRHSNFVKCRETATYDAVLVY